MLRSEIKDLIKRYLQGSALPTERQLVDSGFNNDLSKQEFKLSELQLATADSRLRVKVFTYIKRRQKLRRIRLWSQSAAAILLLGFVGGRYFLNQGKPVDALLLDKVVKDQALLTLTNGQQVRLNESLSMLNQQDLQFPFGFNIPHANLKTYSDFLVNSPTAESLLNVLSTPFGGKYELLLADGTRIWLNAGSKISYPSSFANDHERKVFLDGEAYFEVASAQLEKGQKKSFIVETKHQQIEVLGTHFNVNAYAQNTDEISSLYEGVIRVRTLKGNKSLLLQAQETAVFNKETGEVQKLGLKGNQDLAWKNGEFVFEDQNLDQVMEQIARWYQVEVIFIDSSLKKLKFGGSISRYSQLKTLLNMLELTEQVRFKRQDNVVQVYAY